MAVEVATGELLLEELLKNPNIKAAVLVDDRGYILDKRGTALALKGSGGAQAYTGPPSENLYMVQAGPDFLIVVFDERLNFERLKASVDATLAEFDMPVFEDEE